MHRHFGLPKEPPRIPRPPVRPTAGPRPIYYLERWVGETRDEFERRRVDAVSQFRTYADGYWNGGDEPADDHAARWPYFVIGAAVLAMIVIGIFA